MLNCGHGNSVFLFACRHGWTRAGIGQGGRSGVCSTMLKSTCLVLATVLCAWGLQAQSEPDKAKPLGSATPPPMVHDPAKPAADKAPPPAAKTDAQSSSETGAKPQIDKNPPAFDLKNMD